MRRLKQSLTSTERYEKPTETMTFNIEYLTFKLEVYASKKI